MDLNFTEEQLAVAELAASILADHSSPEVLRDAERRAGSGSADWPRSAWRKLAESGLLGVGLPAEVGGGGLGFGGTAALIEQIASAAAPLPGYATLVLGALPIAQFGSDAQRARWLPGVIDGSTLLTGVLVGIDDDPGPVLTRSSGRDGVDVATGVGWYVPYGRDATAAVVSVGINGGDQALAVVSLDAEGVTTQDLVPMNGEPTSAVHFSDVRLTDADLLEGSIGGADRAVEWLRQRAIAATCVAQAGTCAGALALTASYVSTREQFGVKLATLQAVSQRAADAWIDTELVRLTAWSAAWRLAENLDAADELSVAKFFTAEAAQRVVAAAQHLHGGIGMDLDYPVHRYFRQAKEHELRLGGGTADLAEDSVVAWRIDDRFGDLIDVTIDVT